ncbi:dipeptide/oligopeptide/nickel ABC transporter permease/ATP-binding protein [Conexibacter woesei]|uniref:Oligopeptide/dipeptide ABC transporter, ATPase subunit n=1 Tax=Conexibacter woesei (strain DSM 14684 / CCUG 47730 / CIP 108061 / JCM 11494 / NBRC 100937 / ID131577) TaxID=469383 RepID=D3FCH6_CONWI|nr:dipeptide/oligopeptide/nickel ABC transporter permease/ATP-binding protein [Conexibacter woesei]ADB49449.1 oligopeptide/dipeptide ABC transporter, ATPase subunit [Conexibacter woesei DSM 14684]
MSTTADSLAAATELAAAPRPNEAPRLWRRLVRRPVAVLCLLFLAALVVVAIVAPILLPDVSTQKAGDLNALRQGPSAEHLLGTDSLGRDELERLLVGTRVTLLAAVEALVVACGLAIPIGILAGYRGGRIDRAVGWFVDLGLALPVLIIVIVVVSVFQGSTLAAMIAFGVLGAPGQIRVIRSAVLPVREELYVAAARVTGLSRIYIMRHHILPRISGPILVQASLFAGAVVLAQAGLAFLNLLGDPPAPSWGQMMNDGTENIVQQPWLIWPPGIAMMLTVMAFGFLGDTFQEALSENWRAPVRRKRGRRMLDGLRGHGLVRLQPVPAAGATGGERADALLVVDDLTVELPSAGGPIPVVQGASFEIGEGETVGIVGESGCGKTMTAMSILGLVPGNGTISRGEIVFDGRDLAALGEDGLRKVRGKEIGLISQEPMVSFNPTFRVGWQLAHLIRIHHGVSRKESLDRAVELLGRVRLNDPADVARRYPHELSGGMAQRVSIAAALAGDPKLLIADEPTTALDVTVQAEILELLRDLQRERGLAILLVTHDWGVIADLCERVVVMYAGQAVERAATDDLFDRPLHPYTAALLAANPTGSDAGHELPAIAGSVPKPGAWPAGCHFHLRCGYATSECRTGAVPLARPGQGRETRCIHYRALADEDH